MGSAFGAAAGADALMQVLARKFQEGEALRAQKNQDREYAMRDRDFELRGQIQARVDEDARALRTQREAQTNRINAQMDKAEARTSELDRLVSDPSSLAKMAPLQRIVALGNLGIANVGVHDVESPEEHEGHRRGDRDASFEDFKRKYDYENQNPRPLRIRGARVAGADDPTMPRGSQAYAVEIARKHGGDYQAALAEASEYINGNGRRDHPNLSPQKFLAAVKAAIGRPTGAARPGGGGTAAPQVFGGGGGSAAAPQSRSVTVPSAAGGRGGPAPAAAASDDDAIRFLQSNNAPVTPANIAAVKRRMGGQQ
jgi:hypothetical protein